MTFRKLLFCASTLFIAFSSLVRGQEYSVTSPDGRINAVVAVGDNVKYRFLTRLTQKVSFFVYKDSI